MAFRNLSTSIPLPGITPIAPERLSAILTNAQSDPGFTRLSEGLLVPTLTSHFSPQFQTIVRDYRDTVLCREFFSRSESARWKSEIESASIKFCSIIRDAMACAWDSPINPTPSNDPVQETCRLALVVFYLNTNQTQQMMEISSGYRAQVVTKLKKTLECTDLAGYWDPNGEALVWILFLGAYMSAGHRERSWYIMGLVRGAQRLGLKDWSGVRELMLRFLYLDRVFAVPYEKIWEEVEMLVDVGPSFWHAKPVVSKTVEVEVITTSRVTVHSMM